MEGRALARALALALVLLAAQTAPSLARAPNGQDGARVLVHFGASATEVDELAAARAVGGTIDGGIPPLRIVRILLTAGDDARLAVATLERQRGVVLAEPDAPVHLAGVPNDQYWASDPYTVGLGQWGLRTTQVDRAWDLVRPSAAITVAVVDTGVDGGHPDLVGVTVRGVAYVSAPGSGCDATTTQDGNSHGTHVAGIIAANANNGIGIAGAASGVRIMPVRVLDCAGNGSTSDIAMGIVWAVDHGAKIMSVSLGASTDSPAFADAIAYAVAHGVIVVAASGNCGLAPTRCFGVADLVEYPAAYPGVLGVGATAPDDTIAPFSTQGAQVGVSAPGVRIVSTTPHYATYQSARGTPELYAGLSGTSQAAPLVAAIAALVWSADPTLTAAQVIERIESTADDLGVPGRDPAYGYGRVNALRAVSASLPSFGARYDTAAVARSVETGASFTATVRVTNTSAVPWPSLGASAVKLGYHWIDGRGGATVWDGQRTALGADVAPGTTIGVAAGVVAPPTPGTYTLRFDLVRDGVAWFSQRSVRTGDVTVVVGSGFGAAYAPAAVAAALVAGTTAPLAVALTNTGVRAWSAGGPSPVRLAYHWIRPDGSVAVWDGTRAPAFASDVAPGQTVTAQLSISPPAALGPYTLRLDLVREGVGWFSADGVAPRDIAYVVTTGMRGAYVTAALEARLVPTAPGPLAVTVTNTGSLPWPAGGEHPVRLAYHWIRPNGAVEVWDGARAGFAKDVRPGESVTVQLPLASPPRLGPYTLRLDLVQEGVVWFSQDGVRPRDIAYVVTTGLRGAYATAALETTLVRTAPRPLAVTVTNTGTQPWPAGGQHPVRLAYHWIRPNGTVEVWDGLRVSFAKDVQPGESVTVRLPLASPARLGSYTLRLDLVQEGVGWFSQDGVRPRDIAYVVTSGLPPAPPPVPVPPMRWGDDRLVP